MRIDMREGGIQDVPPSRVFKVIRRDTGEAIPKCFLADDQTGEFGFFKVNPEGQCYRDPANPKEMAKGFGKAPLKILLTGKDDG